MASYPRRHTVGVLRKPSNELLEIPHRFRRFGGLTSHMTRRHYLRPTNESNDQEQLLDRISGLPDEVLGHILSFLPTKSAVGTSILSTRWKYLYRLTTCLYFDDSYATYHSSGKDRNARIDNFKKSVYLFLALHQKPSIVKFTLRCFNNYGTSHLNVWINAAIQKEVRQLYLVLGLVDFREEQPRLPYSFFNCNSLEVIEITARFHLEVPKTVCFPRLKVLLLKSLVFVDVEAFERFMSGCTILDDLTLDNCKFGPGNACIHSATLTHLTVKHVFCTERIKIDAPNLGHVILKYEADENDRRYPNYLPPAVRILKDESIVKHLSLQERTLVGLKEKLVNEHIQLTRLKAWMLVTHVSPSPKHLEIIEVHCFSGTELELFLLEYLLHNAKDLKWLILYKSSNLKMEQELSMAKKLLKLPRISDNCRVELV